MADRIDLRRLKGLMVTDRSSEKTSMHFTGDPATCSKICCKEGQKLLHFPARIAA